MSMITDAVVGKLQADMLANVTSFGSATNSVARAKNGVLAEAYKFTESSSSAVSSAIATAENTVNSAMPDWSSPAVTEELNQMLDFCDAISAMAGGSADALASIMNSKMNGVIDEVFAFANLPEMTIGSLLGNMNIQLFGADITGALATIDSAINCLSGIPGVDVGMLQDASDSVNRSLDKAYLSPTGELDVNGMLDDAGVSSVGINQITQAQSSMDNLKVEAISSARDAVGNLPEIV